MMSWYKASWCRYGHPFSLTILLLAVLSVGSPGSQMFSSIYKGIRQGCPKCGSRADSDLWLTFLGSLHGLDICNT